jgi:hypothetical protein
LKVIYIAGPFRAAHAWAIEQNIRVAEEAALYVWRLGAACLCPHTNTRFFQGAAADHVWLDGDLEMLRRCDAVLMVGQWQTSVGANREREVALSSHIPVFTRIIDLASWLQTGAR